jgi:hypothetical protein
MQYVIADKQGAIQLTLMMNGYSRTPQIQTLHRLIDWLNTYHSLDIAKLPLNTSPLDNNPWFAGSLNRGDTLV